MTQTCKILKTTIHAMSLIAATVYSPVFAQDVELGEKIFKKCKACHAVGESAKKKVGPILNGVYGRAAGTGEDFKYSKSMAEEGLNGLVWDDEALTAFLTKPKSVVKKTKMSFAGLKKEDDIVNVIAYLKTFSEVR